jgi:hypothetical protein
MQKQVEAWRETELSNVAAKMIVYEAVIESELDVQKHLARRVHEFHFRSTTCSRPERYGAFRCVYVRVQGIGADSAVQSDRQAEPLPAPSALRISRICQFRLHRLDGRKTTF